MKTQPLGQANTITRISNAADNSRNIGMSSNLNFMLTVLNSCLYFHAGVCYRYSLRTPNNATISAYVKSVSESLMMDKKLKESLVAKFKDMITLLLRCRQMFSVQQLVIWLLKGLFVIAEEISCRISFRYPRYQ